MYTSSHHLYFGFLFIHLELRASIRYARDSLLRHKYFSPTPLKEDKKEPFAYRTHAPAHGKKWDRAKHKKKAHMVESLAGIGE